MNAADHHRDEQQIDDGNRQGRRLCRHLTASDPEGSSLFLVGDIDAQEHSCARADATGVDRPMLQQIDLMQPKAYDTARSPCWSHDQLRGVGGVAPNPSRAGSSPFNRTTPARSGRWNSHPRHPRSSTTSYRASCRAPGRR
jgi:hypothetical protein